MKPATENIFSISNDSQFKHKTLEIFHYQANECEVYNRYINKLKINIDKVSGIDQIPFLPIEFFKTHTILSSTKNTENVLLSDIGIVIVFSNTNIVLYARGGDITACTRSGNITLYER